MLALMHGDVPTGARPENLIAHSPLFLSGPLPAAVPTASSAPLRRLEARGLTYRHGDAGRGIEDVSLPAARGDILDRNGEPLADSRVHIVLAQGDTLLLRVKPQVIELLSTRPAESNSATP